MSAESVPVLRVAIQPQWIPSTAFDETGLKNLSLDWKKEFRTEIHRQGLHGLKLVSVGCCKSVCQGELELMGRYMMGESGYYCTFRGMCLGLEEHQVWILQLRSISLNCLACLVKIQIRVSWSHAKLHAEFHMWHLLKACNSNRNCTPLRKRTLQ